MFGFSSILRDICAVFIALALFFVALQMNNPFFVALIAVVPFGLLLFARLDVWMVLIICTFASGLRFPGMPGDTRLFHILIIGFVVVLTATRIIVKSEERKYPPARKWIIFFGLVLLMTILVRGTGFRIFGDSKWGGMRYVMLITSMGLVLGSGSVVLTARQLRFAFLGMCMLSFLPLVAEAMYVFSGGKLYHQFWFLKASGAIGETLDKFESGVLSRFTFARGASFTTLILPFILFPLRRKYVVVYAFFITLSFLLAGLSGFRLRIIVNLMILFLIGFLHMRKRWGFYLLGWFLAGLTALIILALSAEHLPLPTQRALSWIPLIEFSTEAEWSAHITTEWRLLVWKEALREIPDYWIIGKGYAFSAESLFDVFRTRRSHLEWALVNVSYHSGPLSLLIGMGAVGLLAGLGLLFTGLVAHYRFMSRDWVDPSLARYHQVFFSWYAAHVVTFVFFYGDVYASFPPAFFALTVLQLTISADRRIAETVVVEDPLPSAPKVRSAFLRPWDDRPALPQR